jgi:protein-ribulosamine 3-kinase
MMEGEFNSMSAIYSVLPSFVPRPIAWGKFQKSPPETFFFLCDFLEMDRELPDPADFCARLAELHRSSSSPNGQFGFHVKTCHGKIVQHNDWDDNWSSYFTKLLENFYQVELSILEERGVSRWPEHEQAFKQMCEHAIPQILGPLQENGRTLKPCLVHGDLWEENTSTNLATGESIVFDASAMYAHNEYELGTWRPEHYRFGRPYFRQYLRNIPPSEPVDQWDDRIRLYSIKFNIAVVIGWAGSQGIREQ